MPVGYLILVLFFGVLVVSQLGPVPRAPLTRYFSFWVSMPVNEQPLWFGLVLAGVSALELCRSSIDSAAGFVLLGLAAIELTGFVRLHLRALPGRGSLRAAIESLGPGAPNRISARRGGLGSVVLPLAFGRRKVERVGDIAYGPAGRENLLDLHRPRDADVTGPTLIYLHGGGFRSGSKRREGQAALYRLAGRGWVCISANYRLSPGVQFPEYVIDLKRVIAWARTEGIDYGVDPERIFLAGGSAGGHVSACAALTENMPELQPGFEKMDTSVAGTVGLYGYYGALNYGDFRPGGLIPSSPRGLVKPQAPPFLVVHGERDTVVGIGNARSFIEEMRAAGNQVAFAELPGAQHTFDLLRSVRVDDTTDAIDDFANWVSRNGDSRR